MLKGNGALEFKNPKINKLKIEEIIIYNLFRSNECIKENFFSSSIMIETKKIVDKLLLRAITNLDLSA